MSRKQGRKIAIVGASGTIGSLTVAALSKPGVHTLTAISRADSAATFPAGVLVKKGDYADESFLISALQGQDALILQLGITGMEQQLPLIQAAAKAGVKYILPTEFGSDPHSTIAKTIPMLATKKNVRDLIEKLGLSWIAVVTNPWLDWSLKRGNWGINIPGRKAIIYKDAQSKFNTTTLHQVAGGVAALVSLPEGELKKFKNSPLYLSSVYVSQRELLDSAIRATGTTKSDWDIRVINGDKAIEEIRKEAAGGNHEAFVREFYIKHLREGLGGDYQEKAVKDAKVLGLEEENLDDVVKAVVGELTASE